MKIACVTLKNQTLKKLFLIAVLGFASSVLGFGQKTQKTHSIPEWSHERVNGKMVWIHNIGRPAPHAFNNGISVKDSVKDKGLKK